MAKKVQVKRAKTAKAAKTDGARAKTAKRVVKAAVKKSAAGTRGQKTPKVDPEVEAARARTRALWKSQEKEAMSAELAKHGTLVDERARVRSHIGMSWSNRKPR